MPDRMPVLIGDKVSTEPTDDDIEVSPRFRDVIKRLTHIEKNATDQSDFDELLEKFNALEARMKVLEQNMFDIR